MREGDLYEMLDAAADAAVVVDGTGIIRFCNHSAEVLFGASRESMLNTACATTLSGRDASGCQLCTTECPVLQIGGDGTSIPSYDLEVRTAAGNRRWVNVSVLVAHTGPKKERRIVHLMRDIDARKKIENLTKEIAVSVGRLTGQEADGLLAAVGARVPAVQLTAQECRILHLLSLGRGTRSIGKHLGVADATVRNHIQHILGKLGAHTRLEAVMRAVRDRLI